MVKEVFRKDERVMPGMAKQKEIPLSEKKKLNKAAGMLKATTTCAEDYLSKALVAGSLHNKKLVCLMIN